MSSVAAAVTAHQRDESSALDIVREMQTCFVRKCNKSTSKRANKGGGRQRHLDDSYGKTEGAGKALPIKERTTSIAL